MQLNFGKKVAIIMATFNGEKFIRDQLDSLITQTFQDWDLYVRDDCSSDETIKILDEYAKKDQRIKIVRDAKGRLKACQNFSQAMRSVNSNNYDYFMFCDQDDKWKNNKIEASVEALKKLEENYKDDFLFSYGTLQLTNEDGVFLNISPPNFSSSPTMGKIIAQNYIYGCTLSINRKLFSEINVIPEAAENHDYWIALVAMFKNAKSFYIREPLIYYRQHDSNVSGNYKNANFSNRVKRFIDKSAIDLIFRRKLMYESFLRKYSEEKINNNYILLKNYCDFLKFGKIEKLFLILKNGVRNFKFLPNISYVFSLIRILLKNGTN